MDSHDLPVKVKYSQISENGTITIKADWLDDYGFPPLSDVVVIGYKERLVILPDKPRQIDPDKSTPTN